MISFSNCLHFCLERIEESGDENRLPVTADSAIFYVFSKDFFANSIRASSHRLSRPKQYFELFNLQSRTVHEYSLIFCWTIFLRFSFLFQGVLFSSGFVTGWLVGWLGGCGGGGCSAYVMFTSHR